MTTRSILCFLKIRLENISIGGSVKVEMLASFLVEEAAHGIGGNVD